VAPSGANFNALHSHVSDDSAPLLAFDLLEINGKICAPFH